jgi:hypothetical protein
MRLIAMALAVLMFVSGCTTTSQKFYDDPSKVGDTSLCRTYINTDDPEFKKDIEQELSKRRLGKSNCQQLVKNQNTQIAIGAVVAVAAVYCAVECGGTGGSPSYGIADWDQFYNENFQLVWACREIQSGRFTNTSNCYGLAKTDLRWPSKSASL